MTKNLRRRTFLTTAVTVGAISTITGCTTLGQSAPRSTSVHWASCRDTPVIDGQPLLSESSPVTLWGRVFEDRTEARNHVDWSGLGRESVYRDERTIDSDQCLVGVVAVVGPDYELRLESERLHEDRFAYTFRRDTLSGGCNGETSYEYVFFIWDLNGRTAPDAVDVRLVK